MLVSSGFESDFLAMYKEQPGFHRGVAELSWKLQWMGQGYWGVVGGALHGEGGDGAHLEDRQDFPLPGAWEKRQGFDPSVFFFKHIF